MNTNFPKLAIPTLRGYTFIPYTEIIYLKAQGIYTHLFFIDNTTYVTSKNIGEYQKVLPEELFFRISNSEMVNISFVTRYNKRGDDSSVVLFISQEKIIDGTIVKLDREVTLGVTKPNREKLIGLLCNEK